MSESIYTAASGAIVQQIRLEVLSNNLANINTVGFKEDRTVFRSYLPGSLPPEGGSPEVTLISGGQQAPLNNIQVAFEGTMTNFSPGHQKYTGNALDLALNGKGFFCVQTPEGTQYTRKGNFSLNKEGMLVTQEGLTVMGNGGEIKIDGQNIVVDAKGNITVDGKQTDTIKIVDFPKPYPLKKVGDTMFALMDPGVIENNAEEIKISQGFVELSNVVAIRVMTEMIEVLRAYESYQKVIKSVDDVTSKAINEVARLA